MLTVRQAKEYGIIQEAYHEIVPETCDDNDGLGCGSELVTNEKLSVIACSNPRCRLKLAVRLASMLSNLGAEGIGYSYCARFLKVNGYTSTLSMFLADDAKFYNTGRMMDSAKAIEFINNAKKKVYTFPRLVSYLALPDLNEQAMYVFRGCRSLEDFYTLCEVLNVTPKEYIMSIPGFGQVLSEKIVNVIEEFKMELVALPTIFHIRPEALETIPIAVTGYITKLDISVNRKDFGRYLNTIGEGIFEFDIGKSLQSCEFIVADEPSGSSTYVAGVSRQKAEHERYLRDLERHKNGYLLNVQPERKILVTSQELVDIIKERVALYKRR